MLRSKKQLGFGLRRFGVLSVSLGVGLSGLFGCDTAPEHERFTQALPQGNEVAIGGPEADARGAQGQGIASAQGALSTGEWAQSYGITREVRDSMNQVTYGILGAIWLLVTEVAPTSVTEDEAVWGPYNDSLKPHLVRFRITKVGEAYEYALEGQPKAEPGAPFEAFLVGKGYDKQHPQHKNGAFTIHLDVARKLDPFEFKDDGTGTIEVQHWLAGEQRQIVAKHVESASERWWRAESRELPDGTGKLFIDGKTDLDDSETDALEDVSLASSWASSGAGRADFSFAGGDVGEPLDFVECWDTGFLRSYLEVGAHVEGSAESCVFNEPVPVD